MSTQQYLTPAATSGQTTNTTITGGLKMRNLFVAFMAVTFLAPSIALAGPQDSEAECLAAPGTWDAAAAAGSQCTLTVTPIDTSIFATCGRCAPTDAELKAFVAEYKVCETGNGTWNTSECKCDAPAGMQICTVGGEYGMYTVAECLIAERTKVQDRIDRRQTADISDLKTKVAATDERVGAVETRVGTLEAQQAESTAALERYRVEQEAMGTRVGALEADSVAHYQAEERLGARVDGAVTDIQVLKAAPKPNIAPIVGFVESVHPGLTDGDVIVRNSSSPGLMVGADVSLHTDAFRVGLEGAFLLNSEKFTDEDGEFHSMTGLGGLGDFHVTGAIPNSPVLIGGWVGGGASRMSNSPANGRANDWWLGAGPEVDLHLDPDGDGLTAIDLFVKAGLSYSRVGTVYNDEARETKGTGGTIQVGVRLPIGR